MFNGARENQDGVIVKLGVFFLGEVVVFFRSSFAFRFGQVQIICVEQDYHIAGMIVYGPIGMSGNIFKELVAGL